MKFHSPAIPGPLGLLAWARLFAGAAALLLSAPATQANSCKLKKDLPNKSLIITATITNNPYHTEAYDKEYQVKLLNNGEDIQIFTNGTEVASFSSEYGDDATVPELELQDYFAAICNAGPGQFQSSFGRGRAIAQSGSSAQDSLSGQTKGRVAIADFNGDGVTDSAAIGSTGILVTLFSTSGTVLSTATYPVAGISTSIVAADFNGDGKIDLAVTQNDPSGPGNIAVLLGKGDGSFGPAAKFPTGPFAFYLTTGDFNGDGFPDLAVTNVPSTGPPGAGTGAVAVLLGKGDGTFAPAVSYPVGPLPVTIVAADFNGDGRVDLAALDSQTGIVNLVNKVWVLLGKGDGTFQPAISTPTGTGSGYLQYADLNHDGKMDLVVADQSASAVAIMLGNGDGTFQPAAEYVMAAQPVSIAPVPFPNGVTALWTTDNISGSDFIFFVPPDGTIPNPQLQFIGKGPVSVAAADLNGDRQPDLAIADPESGNIYVKLATGNGQFGNAIAYPLGSQPSALAIADLNGDGKPDVIAADSSGLDVLLGNGNGTLGAVKTFPAGGSLSSLAVADFNSDGKPDVASANAAAGAVSLFLGTGDGAFQNARAIPLPGGLAPSSVVSGDFNGDGKPDLVVALGQDFMPGALAVLLGKGDGTFQAPVNIALPGPILGKLAVGDFNGDGHLDIVAAVQASPGSNQIVVLLGNGNGSFQTPLLTKTATGAPMIAVTDLDGDGKQDLLLADCCGLAEASLMIGNGDGTFQPEVNFPSGPDPKGIAVADFDGDGKPDFAIIGQVQSPDRGTLAIVINHLAAAPPAATATVISAANPAAAALAPGSLASAYGSDLAKGTPGGTSLPLPTSFGGTTVSLVDSAGKQFQAPLLYVSAGQVNFLVPSGLATGTAQFTITSGDGTVSTAGAQIAAVAPGLFTLNTANLAAAGAVRVSPDGTQTPEQVFAVSAGAVVANPISLGSASDQVYLTLYGTGLQAAGTSGVQVTIAGTNAPVQYAGPQGGFAGLGPGKHSPPPLPRRRRRRHHTTHRIGHSREPHPHRYPMTVRFRQPIAIRHCFR